MCRLADGITGSCAGYIGSRVLYPPQQENGAAGDNNSRASASETRQHCRTASSVGNIRAKGRSGRCFLRRKRATASTSVASTRSWNPPSPCRATTWPRQRASTAACNAPSRSAWSLAAGIQQSQLRPALGTSDRLGVKTAIGRVVILGLACRTHGESRHRSSRPIVGQLADDRPARAAIRAVSERIADPPLMRIANLLATGIAGGQIGGNSRSRRRIARGQANFESARPIVELSTGRQFLDLDRVDPRLGWGIAAQQAQEVGNVSRGSARLPDARRRLGSAPSRSAHNHGPYDRRRDGTRHLGQHRAR